MVSSEHRFKGQNGLLYVYRRGQTVRTKYAAAKFVTNTRVPTWRVAVVVSKKIAKSAPDRNRIRRRLYEQLRVLAPEYLTNQDVVITVFSIDILSIAPAEVTKLVRMLLEGIKTV
jgi:ribonuclease P protein component